MAVYSKQTVLAEALYGLLKDDNTNTGQAVREVHYYVADRIYRGNLIIERSYPHITYNIFTGEQDTDLPTGEFFIEVFLFAEYSDTQPLTKLESLSARIINLLTPSTLNAKVFSKDLRCRVVQVISSAFGHDDVAELHRLIITLKIQCDN